jgi:hypothetical protein
MKMQLGRLTQNLTPAVEAETISSAADSATAQSQTGITQGANLNLYQPDEEAKKIVEAATQLNPNLGLSSIPRPVPPTPDPLGLRAPIQFMPRTLAERGGLGVVLTKAGYIKPGDLLANARTEADILNGAQQAGLSPDELNHLKQILDSSPDFKADASLLKEVLSSWNGVNADRALRTFMDLDPMRRAHPDRITPDVVSSLVEGVAKSKSPQEVDEYAGVLGENAADRAAQALIAMPQGDYNAIKGMLDQAGHGGDPALDDPGTERALILKAVAARAGQYEHPTINDSLLRPETLEIGTFANQIRGMDWTQLIARTTVAAGEDTLQQRYFDSCSAATVQIARAEADPIYAWKLHDEEMHSQDPGGFIGSQQAELMKEVGGVPVSFQELNFWDQLSKQGGMLGKFAQAERDYLQSRGSNEEQLANLFDSDVTGRDYHSYSVDDSVSARTAAADYMAKLVSQGVDVPISVNWEERNALNPFQLVDSGLSHSLLITDVRGQGAGQVFEVADPSSGQTFEVTRAQLISGGDFGPDGKGRLSGFLF